MHAPYSGTVYLLVHIIGNKERRRREPLATVPTLLDSAIKILLQNNHKTCFLKVWTPRPLISKMHAWSLCSADLKGRQSRQPPRAPGFRGPPNAKSRAPDLASGRHAWLWWILAVPHNSKQGKVIDTNHSPKINLTRMYQWLPLYLLHPTHCIIQHTKQI